MATRSTPSPIISAIFFLLLYLDSEASIQTKELHLTEVAANAGTNLTLRCSTSQEQRPDPASIQWVWHHSLSGKDEDNPSKAARISPQPNGDLLLRDLRPEDALQYRCQDAESNQSLLAFSVAVRTTPRAVSNLSLRVSSVYADVSWDLPDDGGYPVTNFVLAHRKDKSQLTEEEGESVSWMTVEVSSESSSCSVFDLSPNTSYFFRVYAVNELGPGDQISVLATTNYEEEEVVAWRKERLEEQSRSENSYLKIWVVAISVFVVTFAIIGFGISLLLIKNCDHARRRNSSCETTEEEAMELVPHITLNPSFNIDMLEYDEGSLGGNGSTGADGLDTIDVHEDDEVLVRSPILRKKREEKSSGMSLLGGGSNSVRPNG